MRATAATLRAALAGRVVVADGAMGTMLQAAHPSPDDFRGHDGCNEILTLSRPDLVRQIHDAYLAVGVDCVETNTFGANPASLADYGIADQLHDLAQAGARLARQVADDWSTPERPRWVLGSLGPGTKLPTLGHVTYRELRDGYEVAAAGLLSGGADAVLVETAQDLLQAKAAIAGASRARSAAGSDAPILVQVTVESNGTMLLGTEIAAALTALEPLGIDLIGLNCATGPEPMSEHLRHLSRQARVGISCMPNAGLPVLGRHGATYPLSPAELADAHDTFTRDYGLNLVGGCCGTTPEHLRQVVDRVRGRELAPRRPRPEPGVASLYQHVPFVQDAAFLSIGERTNANGSKAFRAAMTEGRWNECVEIARAQTRAGAHLLDVCVDFVGRDGVADMREVVGRLATASTLPLVLDSTEPAVLEAGLARLGGRAVVNSVNLEDGDGPGSRLRRIMPLVREHGAAVIALTIDEAGQARTAAHKVAVADRLVTMLTGEWGLRPSDVIVDCLTFPIATGQEETRRDGLETIAAIRQIKQRWPEVLTSLGISNVSFGLAAPARTVLNSVFLHECIEAGLDAAIVNASAIVPLARIPGQVRDVALDLVHDRRRPGYDPLARFLELFEDVDTAALRTNRATALAALPLPERLQRRIVDGERVGLEADLDAALATGKPALEIINDTLLAGMRTVGDLFGRGEMQLPFVLASAEVMKAAVAHLEPHIQASQGMNGDAGSVAGKGTIVLATVKGDVHDIGKNLVDIILSNNGYSVINLGIKAPISAILQAAEDHAADAIGMSGLLVKSTLVMKENLEEMNRRGVAVRWPVLLGGAALTRAYVEEDLAAVFAGEVRYARDAFEGLRLMDAIAAAKRDPTATLAATLPPRRVRRVRASGPAEAPVEGEPVGRSDVTTDNPVPRPPFWGTRVVKGLALADYAGWLDERATLQGRWGLRGGRGGPSYDEMVEREGRPRLRMWLERLQTEGWLDAGVVYGYFPCVAEGNALVLLDGDGGDRARFEFPRQRRGARLCLADFFRARESGETDVVALQLVTVGSRLSAATTELFAAHAYRDYLELHGLSVQLAEALAEMWHARVRAELGFGAQDQDDLGAILHHQGYRGSRYSFGYPACPDLADRRTLVDLLDPARIGVTLSEELQLHPEQSTDAIVVHHPQARYFSAT